MGNDNAQGPDAIRELKWKEIMSRVDAYRFYIKLCLEANAFFFATTGVILGFYLKEPNAPTTYYLRFFLLLPILMGTVLGTICLYATELQKEGRRMIEEVRDVLKTAGLETEEIPDIKLLDLFLRIFGFIFFLVAALLISVPLLKEAGCLKCVDLFVVIACLILAGGGISTYRGIRKFRDELEKTKKEAEESRKLEESKKLVPQPSSK